jgi:hypothetical protein
MRRYRVAKAKKHASLPRRKNIRRVGLKWSVRSL